MLRGSLAVAAAGTLARPYIANAAAGTASVWWTQGFVPEEDAAFRKVVADYEKASGNTIDYSLVPFAPLMQKIISAITSGEVPDPDPTTAPTRSSSRTTPGTTRSSKSGMSSKPKNLIIPTAYLASQYYNNVKKQRSFYLIPYKTAVVPFHVWNSLVEKAGAR